VRAIAAGSYSGLALKLDGTVWAWGDNSYLELGNNNPGLSNTSVPVQVSGSGGVGVLSGVQAIAACAFHSLALKQDGTVWAWGDNELAQLGDDDPTFTSSDVPVQVSGTGGIGVLSAVQAIAAGYGHSLALMQDGTVQAWGLNAFGELGNGGASDVAGLPGDVFCIVPTPVSGSGGTGVLSGVQAIAGGYFHSLALLQNGTVQAWGDNSIGELGNGGASNGQGEGDTIIYTVPTPVSGSGGAGVLQKVCAISASGPFSFALVSPLSGLSVGPASVVGGSSPTATLTLSTPAPSPGGLIVPLATDNAAASVQSSVTVPAGQTSVTCPVTTSPVALDTTVHVIAGTGGGSVNATLTVQAPSPASLTVAPATVVGGNSSMGTVTLNGPAPANFSVSLTSGNTAAGVGTAVSVSAGQTTATFPISTNPVASNTTVLITASTADGSANANLTVQALSVASVHPSPATVVGGCSSSGTVTISSAAPAGGLSVALASGNPAVTVPATVMVPGGKTSATFTVRTVAVATNQTVEVTATVGASTQGAPLTVTAPVLAGLLFWPPIVEGGCDTTLTAFLCSPAPAGGLAVSVVGSDGSAVPLPASITVPAGATTATVTVPTHAVKCATVVTVTGTLNGVSGEALLLLLH
jgi:hypothetical protein